MKEWCWINIVYQYSKNALSCSSCSYQLWELREHSRYLSTWKHEAWERSIFSYHMPVPLIAILPIFHFFLLDWFLSGKYPSESYLYGSWGRVLVLIFFLVWECHYFFLTLFFFFKFLNLFWLHSMACEMLVPQSGVKSMLMHCKVTEPREKSLFFIIE